MQGALLGAVASLAPKWAEGFATDDTPPADTLTAAQDLPGYYPPALNGLRGSHPGSFEAAHASRDGSSVGPASDTGEEYDLIVVGGGISGLAAAHFFRARTSPRSRVLILENHDDFGGHAKRNEFSLKGRLQLLNGGTLSIESPRPYSPTAQKLVADLGIDVPALARQIEHPGFYERLGLSSGVFLDRETFGRDALLAGYGTRAIREVLAHSALSAKARADIARIEESSVDFMPGLTSEEKKLRLSRISYRDFLREVIKADEQAVAFYQARTRGWFCVGIDAVSALDCWGIDLPGFKGMRLAPGSIARMGDTAAGFVDTGGSAKLHFPDGNATIARLLVRSLLPSAVPGGTVQDVVTARVNYRELDREAQAIRIRLNSTVVRVQHLGEPAKARQVAVTYMRNGRPYTVKGAGCVLACWNMMIPYLCPELPDGQKKSLHQLVKAPLVYTNVALRNWRAFHRLGVSSIHAPSGYHTDIELNPNVDIGTYRSPMSPDEPILLRMERTPCAPGLPQQAQNKAGRAELLSTSFETFERNIRGQLGRILGPGGFDPATDIEAITVNRWPHGYAPEYNPLADPELPPAERPNVLGRARFGRITIANSDAGLAAYTDSAIDQADRAVNELLGA